MPAPDEKPATAHAPREWPPTPTPWFAHGGSVYADDYPNIDRPIAHMDRSERATKAGIYPTERDSNAAFIVHAVNSHSKLLADRAALLEALSLLVRTWGDGIRHNYALDGEEMTACINAARAAIRQAEETA